MILYQNALMTLDYDPTTDVLSVDWPNFEAYSKTEAVETLEKLVEMVRNYDVKKLMVDASKTSVAVNEAEYDEIVDKFVFNLLQTRLQKFARIKTSDSLRESQVEAKANEKPLPIAFKNFENREEAILWLTDTP